MRCGAVLLLLAAGLWAQDGWDRLDAEGLAAKREEARQRRASLGEPVPEEQKPWLAASTERIELIDQLLRVLEGKAALLTEEEIRRRHAAAESELQAVLGRVAVEPGPIGEAELRRYQQEFDQAQAERKSREESLAKLKERMAQADKTLQDLPAREAEAKRKLDAAREEGQGDLARYRVSNAMLELHLARARSAFLQEAAQRGKLRLPMEQAEFDLAQARFEAAQQRLNHARTELAKRLAEEAKREKARADDAAEKAEREADPVTRFEKRIRAAVDRRRAEKKDEEARLAVLVRRVGEEKEALQALAAERESLSKRLALRGDLPGQAADLLRATLKRINSARLVLVRHGLPGLYKDIQATHGRLIEVLDRLFVLQLPAEESPEYQALAGAVGPERALETYTQTIAANLAALRELRLTLEQVETRQSELEQLYAQRLEAIDGVLSFVLSRLIWIRSDAVVGLDYLGAAAGELKTLGERYAAKSLWQRVGWSFSERPVGFLGGLAGIGLLLGICAFLGPWVRRLTIPTKAGLKGALLHTLGAVFVASLLPAALLLAAALVRALSLPATIERPATTLLTLWAAFWFPRRLAWRFLSANGVAVRLYRLPVDLARQILRSVNVITVGGILFYAPQAALKADPLALVRVPRLLQTLFLATLVGSILLLIRRRGALLRRWTGGHGFAYRAWGLAGPILALGLCGIIVMDVLGYREGASFFIRNAVQTLAALLLLGGLYAALVALVEKIAEQVHRRAAEEEGLDAAHETSQAVLDQLTRVVAIVVIAVAAVLLLDFWGVDDSVRVFFDGIHLTEVGDSQYLTLWNVLQALAWLVGAHFLVHNLSGVYQYLVFPVLGGGDAGAQYVLLALSRYVLLLVGYGAALLSLHFSFASLGWLLAAASVGLGFGLQEIVANFVSGLILLFERPIRVGDIISVGETGGVVERINIRATIVTNWDRQQIIVPNKAFITQNLTNWTRNDEIVRRKVQVGVAYGTDVENVLRILTEVVQANPEIRKDPAPRIFFEEFGESSLNFEIWFFCPVPQGKPVMSAVRAEIDRRFKEEGITIPFPQRDLHLKSVEDETMIAALVERRGRKGAKPPT